jgi:hypothetical protein
MQGALDLEDIEILIDPHERKSLDVKSKYEKLEEIHSPVERISTLESSSFSVRHLTSSEVQKRTSTFMYTFANILKLYLGIAFLGLPQGFSMVGVRPAILGLFWILCINCFTTYLLIKARNKYKHEVISSLSDLAVKCMGPSARGPTDAVILVTQASFLIAY